MAHNVCGCGSRSVFDCGCHGVALVDVVGRRRKSVGCTDLPPKKWTGLSCFLLHPDRADVADGRMEAGSIVESFDEGKDVALSLRPCCVVTVMDELGLERVEEALHRCIVVAIGLAAH